MEFIYESNVKQPSTRPYMISFHVYSKHERRKWPVKWISVCFLMLFCLASNTVPKNWHMCVNKGLIHLLIYLKCQPLNSQIPRYAGEYSFTECDCLCGSASPNDAVLLNNIFKIDCLHYCVYFCKNAYTYIPEGILAKRGNNSSLCLAPPTRIDCIIGCKSTKTQTACHERNTWVFL